MLPFVSPVLTTASFLYRLVRPKFAVELSASGAVKSPKEKVPMPSVFSTSIRDCGEAKMVGSCKHLSRVLADDDGEPYYWPGWVAAEGRRGAQRKGGRKRGRERGKGEERNRRRARTTMTTRPPIAALACRRPPSSTLNRVDVACGPSSQRPRLEGDKTAFSIGLLCDDIKDIGETKSGRPRAAWVVGKERQSPSRTAGLVERAVPRRRDSVAEGFRCAVRLNVCIADCGPRSVIS